MLPRSCCRLLLLFSLAAVVRAGGWSYQAPDEWSTHDPAYAACSNGREQSPIDISNYVTAASSSAAFTIDYAPVNVSHNETVVNTGISIQVQYDTADASRVLYREREYRLRQFHLHSPSEHTIAGRQFDMELHLVHADDRNQLLVTAIIMAAATSGGSGAIDSFIDSLQWEHLTAATPESLKTQVSALSALPFHPSYYEYQGSLTTPPCSQGVTWIVMSQIQLVSQHHIERYQRVFSKNEPADTADQRPRCSLCCSSADVIAGRHGHQRLDECCISGRGSALVYRRFTSFVVAGSPDSPTGLPRIRSRLGMSPISSNGIGSSSGSTVNVSGTPNGGRLPVRKVLSDSDDVPLLDKWNKFDALDDIDEADDVQAPITSLPTMASPNANGSVGLRRTTSSDQVSPAIPKSASLINNNANGGSSISTNRRALQSI